MIFHNIGESFTAKISSIKFQIKPPRKSLLFIATMPDAYKEGDYTQPYSLVIGCPVSSLDAVPEGMVAKMISPGS